MVVEVHLHVAGGDVDLVAALGLDTVVVRLLLVVTAVCRAKYSKNETNCKK